MRARKLSFVNFKGGVGKTSLSVNIAATIAHDLHQKVLLVDCDPQSNASIWLMSPPRWKTLKSDNTVLALFDTDQPPLQSLIHESVVRANDGRILIRELDLIPAIYDLKDLDDRTETTKKPYYVRFYEAMRHYENMYDYIIFDCPPGLNKSCTAAIFSSDEILIPANPDELSRVGLDYFNDKVVELMNKTRDYAEMMPDYQFPMVRGVIYNAVNRTARNSAIKIINLKVETLKRESPLFDKKSNVFTISVSQAVAMAKAASGFTPIVLEPKNKIQEEINSLSQYIVSMNKTRGRKSK